MNFSDLTAKGVFITGTDTGVGKTWITGALAAVLRQRGLNAGVWKPIQSGALPSDPEADSYQLKVVAGVDDTEHVISPFSYQTPLTPWIASRLENEDIELDDVIAFGSVLFAKYDVVLVEGVGGLAVPINDTCLIIDLAVRLGFPVIIVARPGLGTINHTLLTISYAKRFDLDVLGVIFNGYMTPIVPFPKSIDNPAAIPNVTDSAVTNPTLIAAFSNISILGQVPMLTKSVNREDRVAAIKCHVAVDRIISVLTNHS